jgi:CTP synthase (UTP-ammonia lyase)
MSKTNKSEALKRVPIRSVEETVDQAMGYLPIGLDLTQLENRIKMRNWMVRICEIVLQNNAEAIGKAAQNAVQEALALAINPDYYAERKKRLVKRKARYALMQNIQKPKTRAQIDFDRLTDAPVKM